MGCCVLELWREGCGELCWKGWELKGVDGGGRRSNEWIRVETNRQWIDELIVHDNNSSE